MLHEASFVAASLDVVLRIRADLLIAILPPLALGAAARVVAGLRRLPYQIHVQDLQPDAALALGMLKPSLFTRLLHALESFGYGGAVCTSSIVQAMCDRIAGKPSSRGRSYLLPNWIRGPGPGACTADPASLRTRLGVPLDAFLVSYSGNLGAKQGLQIFLDAAERLAADPRGVKLHGVIVGSGVEAGRLRADAESRGLRSVTFSELLSEADYAALLATSDACLVTQKRGTGLFFFPSKLLSLWRSGKAVVAVADPGGALEAELRASGGGWATPAEDAEALAQLLLAVAEGGRAAAEARGDAGRAWVERNYDRDAILSAWLSQAAAWAPGAHGPKPVLNA
jgi:colanic acid biosynthesis glycosyl transferase WcaI